MVKQELDARPKSCLAHMMIEFCFPSKASMRVYIIKLHNIYGGSAFFSFFFFKKVVDFYFKKNYAWSMQEELHEQSLTNDKNNSTWI